jgi:hypothetical protein
MIKQFLVFLLIFVVFCPDVDARRRRRRRRRKPKVTAVMKAKRQAKKHFKQGQRLFKRQKYVMAIMEFKKAFALRKHPAIQFNIALSYAYLNNTLAAARHSRLYLKLAKDKARQLPAVLQAVLLQTGVLIINTPDPEAEIFVDGLPVGKGNASVIVKVGKHSVDIRLGERIAARKTIEIKPREERVWDLKEIPREAPRPRRITPVPGMVRPPPMRRAIPEAIAPIDTFGRKKVHLAWFIMTASLAVAAVAAGVTIDFAVTRPAFKEYEDGGQIDEALYQKVINYRNTTIALYAAGGVAGFSAIILAIYTRWRKKERSTMLLTPMVGPESLGFSLRWDH